MAKKNRSGPSTGAPGKAEKPSPRSAAPVRAEKKIIKKIEDDAAASPQAAAKSAMSNLGALLFKHFGIGIEGLKTAVKSCLAEVRPKADLVVLNRAMTAVDRLLANDKTAVKEAIEASKIGHEKEDGQVDNYSVTFKPNFGCLMAAICAPVPSILEKRKSATSKKADPEETNVQKITRINEEFNKRKAAVEFEAISWDAKHDKYNSIEDERKAAVAQVMQASTKKVNAGHDKNILVYKDSVIAEAFFAFLIDLYREEKNDAVVAFLSNPEVYRLYSTQPGKNKDYNADMTAAAAKIKMKAKNKLMAAHLGL